VTTEYKALVEVHCVEEEDVETCGDDLGQICEPVPKDDIQVVLGKEIVEEHHTAALPFDSIVLSLTLHGIPGQKSVTKEFVEAIPANCEKVDGANKECPGEYLAIEVLLKQYMLHFGIHWIESLSS
jgi:hypothetical protein